MNKSAFALMILTLATAAAHAAPCAASADPQAVVQAQVDAYNRHDLDAFVNCYADDVTVTFLSSTHPPLHGLDALRNNFKFLAKAPDKFGAEVLKVVVAGVTVANLEQLHDLPASMPVPAASLVMYEVRNGKILNVWFAPK